MRIAAIDNDNGPYPPSPGGIATQGALLHRGLSELGVDVKPVNFESAQESAIEVLPHNMHGPCRGLPRTA